VKATRHLCCGALVCSWHKADLPRPPVFSDTFPLNPLFASPVHQLVQKNGLSVEMIACAHGNAMPYAQLAHALEK
jgi:hypothetical protein